MATEPSLTGSLDIMTEPGYMAKTRRIKFADGRRAPTHIELAHLEQDDGFEDDSPRSIIDTNMLLGRLKEAAAAAEATLIAEAEEEAAAALEAEQKAFCALQQKALLQVDRTPMIDAVLAAGGTNSAMNKKFDELARKLSMASAAIADVAAVYSNAVDSGVFDKSTEPFLGDPSLAPQFWAGQQERLSAVTKELSASGRLYIKSTASDPAGKILNGTDEAGIISAFVSEVAGRRAREQARRGQIAGLREIEAERNEWATYLTLASWDLICPSGNTALLLASQHGHRECVECLLDWGADPKLANHEGVTPLHIAASRPIAELLLANGADPAALDSHLRTAFMVAKAAHLQHHGLPRAEVIFAFAPAQQLTATKQGKIRSPSAEELAALEATKREERADLLYHQGLGALALNQYDAAVMSFAGALEADPDGGASSLIAAKLEEAEQRRDFFESAAQQQVEGNTMLARLSSL